MGRSLNRLWLVVADQQASRCFSNNGAIAAWTGSFERQQMNPAVSKGMQLAPVLADSIQGV